MGNWRRVNIVGTCDASEVEALNKAILCTSASGYKDMHCLSCTFGIAGLPLWGAEKIDALGNLAERDYDQYDVAGSLLALAGVAPSLSVTVHVGGDFESQDVVASVILKNRKAEIVPPMIAQLGEISEEQMTANLETQMGIREPAGEGWPPK